MKKKLRFKPAPLSSTFMITAILGLAFSGYYVFPLSINYGFAFATIFTMMFIASLRSMTAAPVKDGRF